MAQRQWRARRIADCDLLEYAALPTDLVKSAQGFVACKPNFDLLILSTAAADRPTSQTQLQY